MPDNRTNEQTPNASQGKPTDVRVIGAEVYLLPVTTRVPLKFGSETLTSVTCVRVRLQVIGRDGSNSYGWGETPLSVQWTWPADLTYAARHDVLIAFCNKLTAAWANLDHWGHPIEIGNHFQTVILPQLMADFNRDRPALEHLPYLAALVCTSPFDIALHDAFGLLHDVPAYATYGPQFMNCDLHSLLTDETEPNDDRFRDQYPSDFLTKHPKTSLPVWHLVGGLDPLDAGDFQSDEPNDGFPFALTDWIKRDGLKCLKLKLRGNDAEWDYNRLVRVGQIAIANGAQWLTADFNCTVHDAQYVNDILDRLKRDEPGIFGMLLYVEQPFPYELEKFPIDVHTVAERKPLFLDESAHDWRHVRLGARLGWNGVALKTCKTQTGALLSLCWARAHGMSLMVQDLTNPMLAQIPHVLLAAHADTIMGVESNAMQFYPDASTYEARVHPGLYTRKNGELDLATIHGPGFGYRVEEMNRPLPQPTFQCGDI